MQSRQLHLPALRLHAYARALLDHRRLRLSRIAQGTLPPGTYVYGDYCSGEIFAWDGAPQTLLLDTAMNISSFGEDEQGELYVVDLGGTVSRIDWIPATCLTSIACS